MGTLKRLLHAMLEPGVGSLPSTSIDMDSYQWAPRGQVSLSAHAKRPPRNPSPSTALHVPDDALSRHCSNSTVRGRRRGSLRQYMEHRRKGLPSASLCLPFFPARFLVMLTPRHPRVCLPLFGTWFLPRTRPQQNRNLEFYVKLKGDTVKERLAEFGSTPGP